MKPRFLVPWMVSLACLSAAVTPALAREGVDSGAPGRAELRRDASESTARYRRAKADFDRVAAEVARIEARLVGVEEQQAALRSLATRGVVALYMHDSTLDWLEGFGDGGDEVLEAGRRARLVGGVSQLAGAVVRNLGDSARQIEEDRQKLDGKRREQEVALGKLNRERRAATGRFSAFVAAEREEVRARRREEAQRRRAEAAERRRAALGARASRGQAGPRAGPAPLPLGFVCPMNGPFKWGDGLGAGRSHRGVDLLAPRGTEQVAVVPGTFETRFWGGGGLTLFLLGDDGHTYVYMHLLRVVGESGRHVEQGEVIGLTGASGNASTYHLHFEFHPDGGGAADPHPVLASACPPMPRDR